MLQDFRGVYSTRKAYPLLDTINEIITRFQEGGLQIKWLTDTREIAFLPQITDANVLTLEHLGWLFVMLLLGYCFAAVVFVYETFV